MSVCHIFVKRQFGIPFIRFEKIIKIIIDSLLVSQPNLTVFNKCLSHICKTTVWNSIYLFMRYTCNFVC